MSAPKETMESLLAALRTAKRAEYQARREVLRHRAMLDEALRLHRITEETLRNTFVAQEDFLTAEIAAEQEGAD